MKSIILTTAALLLASASIQSAWAYSEYDDKDYHNGMLIEINHITEYDEVDGLWYRFENGEAYLSPKMKSECTYHAAQMFEDYWYMIAGDYKGDLVIPSTITFEGVEYPVVGLDWGSLNNCYELTSITIPASIRSIDYDVFYHGYVDEFFSDEYDQPENLLHITVDPNNPYYDSRNNCDALIETATNRLLIGTNNTVVPKGVTIAAYAFKGCKGNIVIPEEQTKIEKNTFQEFEGSVTLHNKLTKIGDYAFFKAQCEIKNFPTCSLDTIEYYAFYGSIPICELETMTLPSSLRYVNNFAFLNYDETKENKYLLGWKELYLGPRPAVIEDWSFGYDAFMNNYVQQTCTLYVPKGCKQVYQNTENWKTFQNYVEMEIETTDLTSYNNAIYAENVGQWPGNEVTLPIILKNSDYDVKSYQFDLVLPSGVSIKQQGGQYVYEATNRNPADFDYTIREVTEKGEKVIRVMANSFDNPSCKVSGNTGTILNFTLQIDAEAEGGEVPVEVRNIRLVKTSGTTETVNDTFTSALMITPYLKGDANGDYDVNVGDVTTIVNALYGTATERYISGAADVDGDGKVDVSDIISIVDLIFQ